MTVGEKPEAKDKTYTSTERTSKLQTERQTTVVQPYTFYMAYLYGYLKFV